MCGLEGGNDLLVYFDDQDTMNVMVPGTDRSIGVVETSQKPKTQKPERDQRWVAKDHFSVRSSSGILKRRETKRCD